MLWGSAYVVEEDAISSVGVHFGEWYCARKWGINLRIDKVK